MSDPSLDQLRAARETFSKLVANVRPELLRYCSRMMGSTIDGEDVVQDALARAFYELAHLQELPALRSWLFRIAHNLAINTLVARGRRRESSETEADDLPGGQPSAAAALEKHDAIGLAVGRFLELPPAQRASVILKDVLDLSLDEIADVLGMTIPAVKAALHRGRVRLQAAEAPLLQPRAHTPEVQRYVELFNARDWEGVRSMLASDVRLDLVGRTVKGVGAYFTNYTKMASFVLTPAWMDGREVITVRHDPAGEPSYVVELVIVDGQIAVIRDYVHARQVVDEATFEP